MIIEFGFYFPDVVKRMGDIREEQILKWIQQLLLVVIDLSSINYMHRFVTYITFPRTNIFFFKNRDLKPENLLLSADGLNGDIKVSDFNLAKSIGIFHNTAEVGKEKNVCLFFIMELCFFFF